jgi:hypothetical protein
MKLFFKINSFLVFLIAASLSYGQEGFLYEDDVYDSNIKSVKFHIADLPTSMPIVSLKSNSQLILTFDDMMGGDRYFAYKVIHCDQNWNVSSISELDYLDGFNDEEIQNGFYSQGTRIDYTNYELAIPNEDTRFRISGNYLLLVYNDDTKEPVLTRRFIVSENLVNVVPQFGKPVDVLLLKSHQDVSFKVEHRNYDIRRPLQNVKATIIQNGRWDNYITNITPKFNTPGIIHFDRTQRLAFESFKEFRSFDIRSSRSINTTIHSMDLYEDRIDVLLQLDRSRSSQIQFAESLFGNSRRDINGQFIIESLEVFDSYTQSEYINVFFNLQPKYEYPDADVYLFGKFTDWKLKDDFLLEYDPQREVYRRGVLLKQGYYDYIYLLVDRNTNEVTNAFEGNWYETENDYYIIVYHRGIGDRYDRVIGLRSFNSLTGQ